MKRDTHVYVIGVINQPFIKVGIAENPAKRLRSLQGANPHRLEIYWASEAMTKKEARRHEVGAHFIMEAASSRGEWFQASPYVATWVIHALMDLVEAQQDGDLAPYRDAYATYHAAFMAEKETRARFMDLYALYQRGLA